MRRPGQGFREEWLTVSGEKGIQLVASLAMAGEGGGCHLLDE